MLLLLLKKQRTLQNSNSHNMNSWGSLEAHEQRMNRYNNQPLENVFQAKMNIRSSNLQQEGRRDSFRGQPSNRGHGKHSGNRDRGERRQGNSNSYLPYLQKNLE
ncbi:hypothetical protein QL285_084287 [Trifolium repens]|nr:hypothetical protein QL285_084287 [Trifolium repens]